MLANGFSWASMVPALMPIDRLGQIHAQRDGTQKLEGARLDLARQHADAHVLEIGRRVHRPQAVRDLAKAVLEPAEDAIIHALFDASREKAAERAVHRGARLVALFEQERQIDEAKLGHAVGQIARRLVAEREHAVLDQPEDVLGAVAEIHDVPDILHVDPVAELGRQRIADQFERARKDGRGRSVAAHADGDRIGHGLVSRRRPPGSRRRRSHDGKNPQREEPARTRQRCIWLRTALAAAIAVLRSISRRRTDVNEICGRTAISRSHSANRSRQM